MELLVSGGCPKAGKIFCTKYHDRKYLEPLEKLGYRPDRNKPSCTNNGISQKRIENYLLEVLEKHVLPKFDPEKAHQIWRKRVLNTVGKHPSREKIEKEMAEVEKQMKRLISAVAQGHMESADIKTEMENLKSRKTLLEQSKSAMEVQEVDFESISKGVQKLFKEFKDTFKNADIGAKQRFFRTFFDRIEIGPKDRNKNGEGIERRKLILHTLFPLPNTGSMASPTGFEPVLPA